MKRLTTICALVLTGWSLAITPSQATAADKEQIYYFLVFANAVPGMETEFRRWYDEVHAPEVIAGADFVSAQRFEMSPVQLGSGGGSDSKALPQLMILYKVRTRDIAAVLSDMRQRLPKSPTNVMSPSFDTKSLFSYTVMPVGPEIIGANVRRARARLDAKQKK